MTSQKQPIHSSSKTHSLIPFKFHNQHIRVRKDEFGHPWWIAKDVCQVLDIKNISDALRQLDADEKTTIGITDSQPGRGPQSIIIINEPGLYTLIIRSNKPKAKEFKRWITHEVIPAICHTGEYVDGSGSSSLSDDSALGKFIGGLFPGVEFKNRAAKPQPEPLPEKLSGFAQGLRRGLMFSEILHRHGLRKDDIARIFHLRKLGLSQKETAAVFGVSVDKMSTLEKELASAGLDVPKIGSGQTRMAQIRRDMDRTLGLGGSEQRQLPKPISSEAKPLPALRRPMTAEETTRIVELFNQGRSTRAIADTVGRHQKTIIRVLDNLTNTSAIDLSDAIEPGEEGFTGTTWRQP